MLHPQPDTFISTARLTRAIRIRDVPRHIAVLESFLARNEGEALVRPDRWDVSPHNPRQWVACQLKDTNSIDWVDFHVDLPPPLFCAFFKEVSGQALGKAPVI